MNIDHFTIAQLIATSLTGELTEEEQLLLDNWRNASKEHQLLYDEIRMQENQFSNRERFSSFDKENNWNEFLYKRKRAERKKVFLRISRYAAILLLPICTVLFFLKKESSTSVPDPMISPGQYKAQLTLSTGEVVYLTDSTNAIFAKQEQSIITNQRHIVSYQDTLGQKGDRLIYNEMAVPRCGEYQLRLSDGTMVYLNSETKLRFPVRFSENTREVELEGEAYFEVAENKKKPFIVRTAYYNVEVLSTKFNISSYPTDRRIHTALTEGSVAISGTSIGHKVLLKPNELFTFDRIQQKTSVETVDIKNYTAWKEGKFRFIDERLEDIMTMIKRWYDIELVFEDNEIKEYRFGLFANRHETIDPILRIFEQNGKIAIEREGKILKIKRGR